MMKVSRRFWNVHRQMASALGRFGRFGCRLRAAPFLQVCSWTHFLILMQAKTRYCIVDRIGNGLI
ncbi:hypothetical protein EV128_105154 [Rhizobium azibense]|nr:hypothetical protein EV128_105154 [Rhizobium azibense]